jgi:hypothetical protein
LQDPDLPVDDLDPAADDRPTEAVETTQRVTTKYMTKYERARILGTRALQIRCTHVLAAAASSMPLPVPPPLSPHPAPLNCCA